MVTCLKNNVIIRNSSKLEDISEVNLRIFDFIPEVLGIIDEKGKLLAVNDKVEELVDISSEELVGEKIWKLADKLKIRIDTKVKSKLLKNLAKRIMGVKINPYEVYGVTIDGRKKWAEVNAIKVRYQDKSADLVVFRDITERKEFEERLKESEQKFRSLVEPSDVPIAITDLKGKFQYVNSALANLLGYSTSELLGRPFKNYLHPDDKGRVIRLFLNIMLMRRQPQTLRFKALNKNGEVLHLVTRPTKYVVNGRTAGFQAIMVNMTETNSFKERLRGSQEAYDRTAIFLDRILSDVSDYIIVIDEDYTMKFLNYTAGITYGDAVGKKCYRVVRNRETPCHYSNIPCEVHEIIENGRKHFEDVRLAEAIGRISHVRASPTITSEGKKGIISVSRDITDEKRMEEDLARSNSILRATLESTADGILVVDQSKTITNYNRRWVEMFNIPKSVLDNRDDTQLLKFVIGKIKDPESFKRATRKLFDNPDKESLDTFEWEDGRIFERFSRPQRIGGKTVGRVICFKDITERKQLEEKLRRHTEHLGDLVEQKTQELQLSEMFLTTIIESVPDHLYIKDKNFRYIFVNQTYCDFIGKSKEEILNGTLYDIYPKELADQFTNHDKEVLEKGITHNLPDLSLMDKNGNQHIIYTVKAPLKNRYGKVTHLIGVGRDITELKKLEKIKDQFISDATHELRTPLVSIKGYLDLVLAGKLGTLNNKMESALQVLYRNTDRLLRITEDLLDIKRIESGKLQLNLDQLDLREIINSCIEEIHPFLKKNQKLDLEIPNRPLMIKCDRIRLCQAIMNLLSNATKFTPEEGHIILRVKEDSQNTIVEVLDTGLGIQKKDLKQIFHPFTHIEKPTYIQGTGLGLSVTKGVIEAHRGRIWAESEGERKGSKFIFVLPRITKRGD